MPNFDLELVQLQKIYPGGVLAVQGFDLGVEKGEFISFVGPSGCGKTTTLRMIAGLESITSGELIIRGKNFTNTPAERRPTATIFQNYAIFPHMTVYENIAFGLEVRGIKAHEVKSRVNNVIDKLELGNVTDAHEASLSGGQKQRVALARGLVTQPEILLLDEPLGALDANLRKSIQEELKILQRDLGITFIFVTHAQSEALAMGDRVVVMNNGCVEQISMPFELYTRPKSPFVARFIGRNKIIAGEIAVANDENAVILTRFGKLKGVPTFSPATATIGEAAIVVIPTEYISISPVESSSHAQNNDNLLGTVVSINRVGAFFDVVVRVDQNLEASIEVHCEKFQENFFSIGAQVMLSWQVERASIVKGELQAKSF